MSNLTDEQFYIFYQARAKGLGGHGISTPWLSMSTEVRQLFSNANNFGGKHHTNVLDFMAMKGYSPGDAEGVKFSMNNPIPATLSATLSVPLNVQMFDGSPEPTSPKKKLPPRVKLRVLNKT